MTSFVDMDSSLSTPFMAYFLKPPLLGVVNKLRLSTMASVTNYTMFSKKPCNAVTNGGGKALQTPKYE
jgi:hypothetical protein